uniref:ZP domain-containing protein n=2 Tax=Meloidogyne TaxID=189290 RepID=A0A914LRJ9_MELIC
MSSSFLSSPLLFSLIPLLILPSFYLPVESAFPSSSSSESSILDNAVIGDPLVDCLEERVKLTFQTQKPFTGRIFVKGMVDNEKCVENYRQNSQTKVEFELANGACNMRRSRKLGPEQRGVEQSITVTISFHDIFITKVDRAYRCTCFYMAKKIFFSENSKKFLKEADKVVTNRFDVSMIPTTELIDTARMPLCTYTVRRGSVNGPIVTYASVGEPVFHVWQCDSDMFSMLVHNCFVDDGAGKDRKPLIDEHGCTNDPIIVSDLTYNSQANLAFTEVNVFKFADKVTTYFQCAVSTCMISEGMCSGKTPPRCGPNNRRRRTTGDAKEIENNSSLSAPFSPDDPFTMDLSAERIHVLDLDDEETGEEAEERRELLKVGKDFPTNSRLGLSTGPYAVSPLSQSTVCFSENIFGAALAGIGLLVFCFPLVTGLLIWRQRKMAKISWHR